MLLPLFANPICSPPQDPRNQFRFSMRMGLLLVGYICSAAVGTLAIAFGGQSSILGIIYFHIYVFA